METAKIIFIETCFLYAALDYVNQFAHVAELWEFGRLLTVVSWAWASKGRVAQNRRTALEAVSLVQ